MVRLYLEERYTAALLKEHFGVSHHSVTRWAKAYRELGPDGLMSKVQGGAKPRISRTVKKQIVSVKRSHPEYGPRRIADFLKRFL